jgi:hypothetical protein
MDQVPKEEGMSLNNKTRKLTYTVEVECCQECPMFSEGVATKILEGIQAEALRRYPDETPAPAAEKAAPDSGLREAARELSDAVVAFNWTVPGNHEATMKAIGRMLDAAGVVNAALQSPAPQTTKEGKE